MLPSQICQSQVFGEQIGSNACSIISVLSCFNFLSGKLNFPNNLRETLAAMATFCDSMKLGNVLYNLSDIPASQPNLEVRDVLHKISSLKVHIQEDLGFFTANDIIVKFDELLRSQRRIAGVMIIPPDKSLAILWDYGTMGLLDSHKHSPAGGIISVCTSHNAHDFVAYLALMVARDWPGHKLEGANFTILQLST